MGEDKFEDANLHEKMFREREKKRKGKQEEREEERENRKKSICG